MSSSFYTIMHFVGISLLILSLGGMMQFSLSKSKSSKTHLMLMHGVSLLIIAVSGFGLIAKLNLHFTPWLILKIIIWAIFGVLSALIFKLKLSSYIIIPVLVGLAAYAASMLQNIVL